MPSKRAEGTYEDENKIYSARLRFSVLLINTFLSVGLCGPSTYVWYTVTRDPFWFQDFADQNYLLLAWTTGLVFTFFVMEVALRLGIKIRLLKLIKFHHVATLYIILVTVISTDVSILKIVTVSLTVWTWE
jgi:hypothetical protein